MPQDISHRALENSSENNEIASFEMECEGNRRMSISMITEAISNMKISIPCQIKGDVFKRSGNDCYNNNDYIKLIV